MRMFFVVVAVEMCVRRVDAEKGKSEGVIDRMCPHSNHSTLCKRLFYFSECRPQSYRQT